MTQEEFADIVALDSKPAATKRTCAISFFHFNNALASRTEALSNTTHVDSDTILRIKRFKTVQRSQSCSLALHTVESEQIQ